MYNEFTSNTIYNVVADYEKYVETQKANGKNAVSLIKYALGNL